MDVAPKPIAEVASRLRLLSCAIFEAYVSVDGRHVDYGSIQGSEEFKRLVLRLIDLIKMQKSKVYCIIHGLFSSIYYNDTILLVVLADFELIDMFRFVM